jgi:hypothetical protein
VKREILLRWKRRQCDIHAASYVIMGTGLNDYLIPEERTKL